MAANVSDEQRNKDRVKSSMDRATTIFAEKNIRFTELRRKVFEEIALTTASVGAYEVLDRLSKKGTRLAPVSVYRAIEALMNAGVVHRLESRNAYFACHAAHASERQHVILSCGTCGTIAEVDGEAVFGALDQTARHHGFHPQARIVEVAGRCAHCSRTAV